MLACLERGLRVGAGTGGLCVSNGWRKGWYLVRDSGRICVCWGIRGG